MLYYCGVIKGDRIMRYTVTTTDKEEASRLTHADDAFALIWDIDQKLRAWSKHGIPENKTIEDLADEVRTDICNSRLMEYWT